MANKKILYLGILLVCFFLAIIYNPNNIQPSASEDVTLKTSTSNYLFNSKNYTITLDDVYDDENYTKLYTGANFQYVYMENDTTTFSEAVTTVNNSASQSPFDVGVTIIDGAFDESGVGSSNNMLSNDGAYGNFTSTEAILVPIEYIDSITYIQGTSGAGTIPNTYVDDANYKQIIAFDSGYWEYVHITLVFDPVVGGRDFYISCDIVSPFGLSSSALRINGVAWKTGSTIDIDDEYYAGVNSISYYSASPSASHNTAIYYFKIVEDLTSSTAELNYTIDTTVDSMTDLIGFDLSSFHYTNVSSPITGYIYNYTASAYDLMFTSSNIAETQNYFYCISSVENYINATNNVRLYFSGYNVAGDFNMTVDYVQIRFFYKMDIEYNVAFYTNGLWKYRWELIGSLQYTSWTYFEVITPSYDNNFEAISESSYPSYWVITNTTLSGNATSFWVGSFRSDSIYLPNDTYDIQIYENGLKKVDDSFVHNTDSVTTFIFNETIVRPDNFFALSESDYVTYWILTNTTNWGNTTSFYVNSHGHTNIYLPPDTYEVSIFENGIDVSNSEDIIITHDPYYYIFNETSYVRNFYAVSESHYATYWSLTNMTNFGNATNFWVSPLSIYSVSLTPDTYNLKIYEGGVGKIDENIVIVLDAYYYVFNTSLGSEFNFHAVSECDEATRWIILNATAIPEMEFNDDINTTYWNVDVDSDLFIPSTLNQDNSPYLTDNVTYVDMNCTYGGVSYDISGETSYPDGTFFHNGYWWLSGRDNNRVYQYYENWTYTGTSHSYAPAFRASSLYYYNGFWYVVGDDNSGNYKVWEFDSNWVLQGVALNALSESKCIEFWEGFWYVLRDRIGLNEQVIQYTTAWVATGASWDISVGDEHKMSLERFNGFWWTVGADGNVIEQWTDGFVYQGESYDFSALDNSAYELVFNMTSWWLAGETTNRIYRIDLEEYNYSKNYFGNDYMYMQTNLTESISLESQVYAQNYTLSTIDYFEIDCQASTNSLIEFIMIRDGTTQKTLVLIEAGNTNFKRQTIQLSTNTAVQFDQLTISSIFEDTDFLIVYDIRFYNYTDSDIYDDFWLSPNNQRDSYLNPDIYNIKVFIGALEKIDENITISASDYYYVYSPVDYIESRLVLWTPSGTYLNFERFHIYITRTLNEHTSSFWLLDNIFHLDKGTNITVDVYDQFNELIDSFDRVADTFIGLTLYVYSLTIKNIMVAETIVVVNTTSSYELLSYEVLAFLLPQKDYEINWTDDSGSAVGMLITLNSNQAYELNTTYYNVYFTLYDTNLHIINPIEYIFRLDGQIKDFGLIEDLSGTSHVIDVMDRFGVQLNFSSGLDFTEFREFRIDISLYELQIRHLGRENSNITIYEETTNNTFYIATPDSIRSFLMGSSNYEVYRLNEEDGTTNNYPINITTFDRVLVLNTTYYNTYFTLYDTNLHIINPAEYTFRLDGSIVEFGLIVDLNATNHVISVVDRFGVVLNISAGLDFTEFREFRVDISLYELQIRHLGNEDSAITIYEETTNSTSYIATPDSIRAFIIGASNYAIWRNNGENGLITIHNVNITASDVILNLNTTYSDLYLSIFASDGLGLNPSLVRLYINGTRKDFGYNLIRSQYANLTVLDFFNHTLAQEEVDASIYTEWNIFCDVYTMDIINQFDIYDLTCNVSRVGTSIWMNQTLPAMTSMQFRFIANVSYNIDMTFLNGTIYSSTTVNLTDQVHIVSFGHRTTSTSEYPKDVYISAYTQDGFGIDYNLLRFYLNGNRTDFGFTTIETDMNNITIMDYLNTSIYSQMVNFSGIYEFDCLVTLWHVKLFNDGFMPMNFTITLGSSLVNDTVLPNEIVQYTLSPNTYNLSYTNQEDMSLHTFWVVLNQNRVYVLNSTYFDIYFSMYNYDGVGLSGDWFKFYINGDRRELGFNTITQDVNTIAVLDFFNSTLHTESVNLSLYQTDGFGEYSFSVVVYTIFCINNFNRSIQIEYERTSFGDTTIFVLHSRAGIELKILPNVEYEITAYEMDGIDNDFKIDSEVIELGDAEDDYTVVSFGFFEQSLPNDPLPLIADLRNLLWILIFIIIIGVIIYMGYMRLRRPKDKVPTYVKKRYNNIDKKKSPGTYNYRIND